MATPVETTPWSHRVPMRIFAGTASACLCFVMVTVDMGLWGHGESAYSRLCQLCLGNVLFFDNLLKKPTKSMYSG